MIISPYKIFSDTQATLQKSKSALANNTMGKISINLQITVL